jgi:hypothetical protein
MATIWFMIVAVMVAIYVLLDGFDLGAGAVHLFIARTDEERRTVIRAIGPVWDGNEVWLLAAGGTLYFAFPLLYASSFSGFYLPLMMVLWLLMLRAIGIEFRAHIQEQVWKGFFDAIFGVSSILLAIFLGAALGNVVRGVPLNADGYFFEPLWTNWRVGAQNGILDWYTVMCGVVALVTLVVHGSLYLATKTQGELNEREKRGVALVAGAGIADHLQPDRNRICRPACAGELFSLARRIPGSRTGDREPCLHVLRSLPRAGARRVRRFVCVHRRNAGWSSIRSLSQRVAGEHRRKLQPHDCQHRHRRSWNGRGLCVVVDWDGPGGRVFYLPLSHVPREGATGRR